MNVAEMVKWFQQEFPDQTTSMMLADHHFTDDKGKIHLNPYHLEGDVWTHVMMVMQECRNLYPDSEVVKWACLGHDLGKPMARYEVPEKNRVRMSGHEGSSVYFTRQVMNHANDPKLTPEVQREICEIINWHQELFKELVDNGERFAQSAIKKFQHNPIHVTRHLLELMTCDGNGRYAVDQPYEIDWSKSHMGQFEAANYYAAFERAEAEKYWEGHTLTVLIGPPGAGKSTWRDKRINSFQFPNQVIISRDDIIMGLAANYMDYNQAWATVDQKQVDSLLAKLFQQAVRAKTNIIVDMTNMSKKSRRKWVNQVPQSYRKKAVVFVPPYDIIMERNKNRVGKVLDEKIIHKMMLQFHTPLYSEFDKIQWILE